MKSSARDSLGGREISRRAAFRGLGNPDTWEKDAARLEAQFSARPKAAKKKVRLSSKLKSLTERPRESVAEREPGLSELVFARRTKGAAAKEKRKNARANQKAKRRRSRGP